MIYDNVDEVRKLFEQYKCFLGIVTKELLEKIKNGFAAGKEIKEEPLNDGRNLLVAIQ